jgi:putative PIN family toxin of toxin-antitoxin system
MPPRAVADANVFVAAAVAPAGVCGRLVSAIAEQRWQPVACPMLIDEVIGVLHRGKLRRLIGIDDVDTFIRTLRVLAHLVPDPAVIAGVTPDPDDDYIVALAKVADVPVIVSGDQHLRSATAEGIRVVSPGEFLRQLD